MMKTKRLLAFAWLATFAAAFVVCEINSEYLRQMTLMFAVIAGIAILAVAFLIGTLWSLGQLMGEQ